MKLKLVKGASEEILRTRCDEVLEFDSDLGKLVESMKKMMVKSRGVGIAAPQVDINARIFIFTKNVDREDVGNQIVEAINPEVLSASSDTILGEEGCLSLPGVYGNVRRPLECMVSYLNVKGEKITENLRGFDARVFLHELDHLNGVLFIDKLEDQIAM